MAAVIPQYCFVQVVNGESKVLAKQKLSPSVAGRVQKLTDHIIADELYLHDQSLTPLQCN